VAGTVSGRRNADVKNAWGGKHKKALQTVLEGGKATAERRDATGRLGKPALPGEGRDGSMPMV